MTTFFHTESGLRIPGAVFSLVLWAETKLILTNMEGSYISKTLKIKI